MPPAEPAPSAEPAPAPEAEKLIPWSPGIEKPLQSREAGEPREPWQVRSLSSNKFSEGIGWVFIGIVILGIKISQAYNGIHIPIYTYLCIYIICKDPAPRWTSQEVRCGTRTFWSQI